MSTKVSFHNPTDTKVPEIVKIAHRMFKGRHFRTQVPSVQGIEPTPESRCIYVVQHPGNGDQVLSILTPDLQIMRSVLVLNVTKGFRFGSFPIQEYYQTKESQEVALPELPILNFNQPTRPTAPDLFKMVRSAMGESEASERWNYTW